MKTARVVIGEWFVDAELDDEDMEALSTALEARDREVAVKILRDAATVAYAKNLLRAHSFLLERAERAERGE